MDSPSSTTLSAKEGYSLWASTYTGDWVDFFEEERIPTLLEKEIGSLNGKRILDAGCGTGRNLLKLAKRGARVSGIDISPEMINQSAKALLAGGYEGILKTATLEKIPFPPSSFDAVISCAVLDHVKDLTIPFHEFAQVLKKGGTLIIAGPHPDADLTIHAARFHQNNKTFFIQEHPHSLPDFDSAAKQAGFRRKSFFELHLSDRHCSMYPPAIFEQEKNKKTYILIVYTKP